ncbi:MAG: PAS domain S-box protein [Nitrospirae bacterium]|nr:PAS domain S-box protein [Nitrospirota bacterium]
MGPLDDVVKAVATAIGIDAAELARRKAFLEFDPAEAEQLKALHERLAGLSGPFLDTFYAHLTAFEETRALLSDPAVVERLKRSQLAYFNSLTTGDYGEDYVANRLRIGLVHRSVGLEPKWYIGAYGKYLSTLLPEIWRIAGRDPQSAAAASNALIKAILLDIGLTIDTFVYAKFQTVERLKRAIEKVVASVPLGTVVLSADLVVLSTNRLFRRIIGGPDQSLRGRALEEILPRTRWWEELAKMLSAEGARHELTMDYTRGEEARILRVVMTAIERTEDDKARVLLTVEDVTDQKRAELELRASEERFRQVTENSRVVFWMTDPEKHTMLYISPGYEVIWGRARESLYASPQSWLDAIHPEDRERVRHAAVTKQVRGDYHEEYRIVWPTGAHRWILDRAFPVTDETGRVYRIVGIAEDITARKRTEDALKKTYDDLKDAQGQLVQAEKMSSLGQLAAGVAHEINNPIGFVASNLRTLSEYVEDIVRLAAGCEPLLAAVEAGDHEGAAREAKQLRVLAKQIDTTSVLSDLPRLTVQSLDGVERVQRIVRNLKTFSHVDQAERTLVNVNEGIESTLAIVWNELKYKADVVKELGPVPRIVGYPQQLNQVFVNLLVNAAHAMTTKGTIWIRTFLRDHHVVVEVEDTGSGIAPEHLKKIFDPFFTTKPVGKGTGLGLSISYGIVQKHGGTIEVDSEVGRGTQFRVVLPLEESPARPAAKPPEDRAA